MNPSVKFYSNVLRSCQASYSLTTTTCNIKSNFHNPHIIEEFVIENSIDICQEMCSHGGAPSDDDMPGVRIHSTNLIKDDLEIRAFIGFTEVVYGGGCP